MSARARVWIIVALAAAAAAGTVVGVTLATRNDVQPSSRASRRPSLRTRRHRPKWRNRCAKRCRPGPSGTARRLRILAERYPHSALVQLELGLALALSGQQADATRAWQAAERAQPDSPSAVQAQDLRHPGTPARPAAVRPELHARDERGQSRLLRGAAYQQAPAAGLRRTGVRRGGEGRSERPRGADRRGRRPLRQGPARPGFLASRAARPPFPASADRALPSRAPPDLLRGYGSCPSRAGPRPRARPTNTAWKEGRNASEGRSKVRRTSPAQR